MEAGAARPRARSEELVVEELDDQLLVYDLRTDQAHALSADAARVWRCCDGETSVEALGASAGVELETTQRALAELESCGLLDSAPGREQGSTRREATVKLAKLGAAAASAPLIASIVAPAGAGAVVACENVRCSAANPCAGSGCCCCTTFIECPGRQEGEGCCKSTVACNAGQDCM
jgi:hypothetical protein